MTVRTRMLGTLELDEVVEYLARCLGRKGVECTLTFRIGVDGRLKRMDAHEGPINLGTARDVFRRGRDAMPLNGET